MRVHTNVCTMVEKTLGDTGLLVAILREMVQILQYVTSPQSSISSDLSLCRLPLLFFPSITPNITVSSFLLSQLVEMYKYIFIYRYKDLNIKICITRIGDDTHFYIKNIKTGNLDLLLLNKYRRISKSSFQFRFK